MLAIPNQRTLWRKKWQCDAKDVKSKTKTANPVKFANSESRTNRYAEGAKKKLHKIIIYVNKQDQQQKTIHRALQTKVAKILLNIFKFTISTICLRQHQQQCTQCALT